MLLINVLVISAIVIALVMAFVEDTIEMDNESKVMDKMDWDHKS